MKKQEEKDESTLTKEQAKTMVLADENGMVHTFYNVPFGIIGGDHELESVLQDIDDSFICKKTGPQAMAMGHGLAVVPSEHCKQSDILFVETKQGMEEIKIE